MDETQLLRESLQDYEDVDDGYLGEDLKELRHVVMFAHYRIERSLEVLIISNIRDCTDKLTIPIEEFAARISPVLEKMEFWPKMEACREMNLIEGSLVGKIDRVNTLRKYFSHPASFRSEVYSFKDETEY